jgi:hypothetical protein
MRYRLRTLLVLMAVLPVVWVLVLLAAFWWGEVEHGRFMREQRMRSAKSSAPDENLSTLPER